MVNNLIKIRSMLSFDNEGDFYFLQIIKRRKDNPGIPRTEKMIADYSIGSVDVFDQISPSIIELCEYHNARAYIYLNRRNFKSVAMEMMIKLPELIKNNQQASVKSLYQSCAGKIVAEPKASRIWVVDIDSSDDEVLENSIRIVRQFINSCRPYGDKIETYIPSKTGMHIITKPFDLKKFKGMCKCDVFKNAMTIVYCP